MLAYALVTILMVGQEPQPRTVTISPTAPITALAPGALPEQPQENERLICRTESVVGSNRRRRICMSAQQRQAMREQSMQFRDGLESGRAGQAPRDSGELLRDSWSGPGF